MNSGNTNIKFSPVDIESRKKLNFKAGDTVKVWSKIQEKGKIRLQAFEGLVLARKHGTESGATFTVRKIASGVGVEKIFPLYSPNIDKIEITKKAKVRRSKLYYIRDKVMKEIRRKIRSSRVVPGENLPTIDHTQPTTTNEEVKLESSEKNVETPPETKEEALEEEKKNEKIVELEKEEVVEEKIEEKK